MEVRADSELMVKQINGQYRVKHPNLIPLHAEAKQLMRKIPEVKVVHVRREQNKDADRLSNIAIDKK
ncbi:MAG: reverse transcriptase-like protein [Deltaproteobacteria bacterium]|nr:MAG: reverse transcriptase-like protein [Deltaproteobacteria bacterium]